MFCDSCKKPESYWTLNVIKKDRVKHIETIRLPEVCYSALLCNNCVEKYKL